MARAGISTAAAPVGDGGGDGLAGLAEKEAFEIGQYGKIMQFRDLVLSGKHPTIKLPPGLRAIAESLPARAKSSSVVDASGAAPKKQQSAPGKAGEKLVKARAVEVDAGPGSVASKAAGSRPAQRLPAPGRTEINPILLEKSDELIRAEFQLQRQRLERSLKEELEERRVSKPQGSLVAFDLSHVLTKALDLVEATAPPPLPADEDLTANHEAASDSFDDDTFYSSHHDTPESNLTSRVRNPSDASHLLAAASSQKTSPIQMSAPSAAAEPSSPTREAHRGPGGALPPGPVYRPQQGLQAGSAGSADSRSGRIVVPGLDNYVAAGPSAGPSSARRESAAGGEVNRTREQGHAERAPPIAPRPVAPLPPLLPPSPVVRTQNAQAPAAPRHQGQAPPPPKAAQKEPIAISSGLTTAVPSPAQVVTLRNEPTVMVSDTSSNGERDHDKRKGKKKKRKADRQAPEAEEAAVYIKPEPRSASPPISALSHARPSKRQRQAENQAENRPIEPDAPDPGYARPSAHSAYDPHHPQIYRQERVPVVYEEPVPYPRHIISTGEPTRYDREYIDEYPMPSGAYYRRALSPGAASYSYSSREAHPTRPITQVLVNDPYRDPSRVYRDQPLERPRYSVRPEGDAFVVPPRPAPTRIVVDAFGREYFEPPQPISSRHSVAPPSRAGEPEYLYERVPTRAMSGHPGAGPYDDGGAGGSSSSSNNIVYSTRPPPPPPPPPQYAVTRRYIAQPEYVPHEYHRDARPHDREYSTQPAPTSSREYVRLMTPLERRPTIEERPREYLSRMPSVRPSDHVRYEAPHASDYGRMHSARPEASGREHAGSVHPEGRHAEGPAGFAAEYGSGAVQQQQQQQQQQHQYHQQHHQQHQQQQQPYPPRREYSVRPADRYHEPAAQGGRRGEEIAFIEGPGRRTQEIVYVDDGRREVYRA